MGIEERVKHLRELEAIGVVHEQNSIERHFLDLYEAVGALRTIYERCDGPPFYIARDALNNMNLPPTA